MDLKAIKTLTAAALLAATTAASAATSPFNMVSGPTTPGVDVSLTLQESVMPGYDYDFVVSNSSLMGIVTGVYFEMDWNSLLNNAGMSHGDATLVGDTHSPEIDGWAGTKASHTVEVKRVRERAGGSRSPFIDVYYDVIEDGILEGGSQTFSFNVGDGVSLEDLESMLGTDGYGVAIRMQGLSDEPQERGWGEVDETPEQILVAQAFSTVRETEPTNDGPTEVVSAPSPTAALAGLVVAGIAGLRRRRK
eukprot:g12555.t1